MTGVPSGLIEALEERNAMLERHAHTLESDIERCESQVLADRKELETLRAEQVEIERLRKRYASGDPVLFVEADRPATESTNGNRFGPSDVLVDLVKKGRGGRLNLSDLFRKFEEEFVAGHIETTTKNPRKLASSITGQLVRTGRLIRMGSVLHVRSFDQPAAEEGAP